MNDWRPHAPAAVRLFFKWEKKENEKKEWTKVQNFRMKRRAEKRIKVNAF